MPRSKTKKILSSEQINVRVTPQLRRQLEQIATESLSTVCHMTRIALTEFVTSRNRPCS
jgi:predicted transcriptional regulator